MPYQCLDCSYRGNHFANGVCPGCGSQNITRVASPAKTGNFTARKPYRLLLAVALWLYLLVEVWRVLSR